MAKLPANSVDLVITDPPFAIDFKAVRSNYNRTDSRVIDGYHEIRCSDYGAFTEAWLSEGNASTERLWQHVRLFWMEPPERRAHRHRYLWTYDRQSFGLEVPVWRCHQAEVRYVALPLHVPLQKRL